LLAPHRKANDRLNVRDLQFNNFRDWRTVTEILGGISAILTVPGMCPASGVNQRFTQSFRLLKRGVTSIPT